ncbi:MAG: MBOAT family protein [Lachnospiraceae bacterium]|nr:MBOAT family protein [Lachnospiraceae bacterium]
MVFSSMTFLWLFLPVVLLPYWLLAPHIKVKGGNILLLIASLFFYSWGEPVYILLMLLSVCMNYGFALWISRNKGKRLALFCDVAGNLLLLCFFKYAAFFTTYLNKLTGGAIEIVNIALPLGISFYTFQAMSYVIDVYRGETAVQKNLGKVMLYISLFPQLIAGPIVQYKDIEKQIDHRTLTAEKKLYGIRRFLFGLAKKVLLANFFGIYADKLFGMHVYQVSTGVEWLKMLFYALQIYYDFSGYSDMAIGLGSMFGFSFKENFNYPYVSTSAAEHWRRWHISLGAWFRDYVYIPLGGSRKGLFRTCVNTLIVFFLTGFWHGASLRFIVWGLFYGVFICFERLGFGRVLEWLKKHRLGFVTHIYYWILMLTGWVFFRESGVYTALYTIRAMFLYQSGSINIFNCLNAAILVMLILGILLAGPLQLLFPKLQKLRDPATPVRIPEFVLLMGLLFLSTMSLVSDSYNAFIYFRF